MKPKFIIIILSFCLCQVSVYSQRLSVDAGGLMVHLIGYRYDLSDINETLTTNYFKRVVLRPQIGITYSDQVGINKYYQVGFFTGQDCLYGDIYGVTTGFGWSLKHIKAGCVVGLYKRDKDLWNDHYFKASWCVPVIGIDITLKKEFNRIGVELSNKITPIMTVHNVTLSYKL